MRTNFRAPQPLVPTLRQPSSLPALARRCAGSPVPTRNGLLLRISGGRARRNRLICILIFARPNPWLFPCVSPRWYPRWRGSCPGQPASRLVATRAGADHILGKLRQPSSPPALARIMSWTTCVSPRRYRAGASRCVSPRRCPPPRPALPFVYPSARVSPRPRPRGGAAGSPVVSCNGLLLRVSGASARRNRLICVLISGSLALNPAMLQAISAHGGGAAGSPLSAATAFYSGFRGPWRAEIG